MPWQECSTMNLRQEFLFLASQPGSNFSQLCQRFGISRKTGYKWLHRYQERGAIGLADRSRRPRYSPGRTDPAVEQQVLAIRDQYGWGARKIKWCLQRDEQTALARSTAHSILQRNGRVTQLPNNVA